MRRTFVLAGVAIAVLVGGTAVAYFYLEGAVNPVPFIISPFTQGVTSDYAYESSTLAQFNLSSPRSVLSGGFTTNTSADLFIMSGLDYQQDQGARTPPQWWYYTTGNVRTANVNVSLYQGTWYLLLDFLNDTGRTVHTSNGTSVVSDTHLTITRTFTVAPEDSQASNSVSVKGPTYLELVGPPGSQVNGTLAVNMSAAGYLNFKIDSEGYVTGDGNGSSSRPSSAVVPYGITTGGRTAIFAILPHWNGSQAAQWPSTGPIGFNQGTFPGVVTFNPSFKVPAGTPSGQYLLVLTVFCYPLDLEGTPGYSGPASLATFSVNLTVS